MPAYNFQECFAEAILSQTKCQTIRPPRKRPTRPGDMLTLYAGQRTKACRRLATVRCVAVTPLAIFPYSQFIEDDSEFTEPAGHGRELSEAEVEAMARADGFDTRKEFFAFFARVYESPYLDMELIKWELL